MKHKNHQVTIQRRSDTQDALGHPVDTWADVATLWAAIEPVSGREYFNASGERATVTHKVSLWYGTTVAPRDRISYGSRVFSVRSVLNIEERNRELLVMCEEVVT